MSIILKKYIKYILKENKEYITKLHVFDFDATLFKSPSPSDDWVKANPNKYWWSSYESLSPETLGEDISSLWIDNVVEEARKSIADQNTIAILCTARSDVGSVRYRVTELLREHGLKLEKLFFKPLRRSISGPAYKAGVVKMLLNAYPNIEEVVFWDDKSENLDSVDKLIKEKDFYNPDRPIRYIPELVI